jgi:hypothetical protein
LLVVFGTDILIFSDKDCEFPDSADAELAWSRWYRRAVLKSAEQIWGAERWLRENPERVFLDRRCTAKFPLALPAGDEARFHRIVVAHDRSGRRRRATGGSGSLMIDPTLHADAHLLRSSDGGHPFAVGLVDPGRGFIHVLDEVSVEVVLRTLDTITDLTKYLNRKEELIRSGRLAAFGEEDLLALYLRNVDESDDHVFVLPPGDEPVILHAGQWLNTLERPEFKRKLLADRVSYFWDSIIEFVSGHAMAGTLEPGSAPLEGNEQTLRVLARENRVRRRMLARGFREVIEVAGAQRTRRIRVSSPSHPGDPPYAFVAADPRLQGRRTHEEYRNFRKNVLSDYAVGVTAHYPEADTVVGIATEGGDPENRSFDLVLVERGRLEDQDVREAKERCAERGWFKNVTEHCGTEYEFPDSVLPEGIPPSQIPRVGRNEPCPCGGGKKYKECHGA